MIFVSIYLFIIKIRKSIFKYCIASDAEPQSDWMIYLCSLNMVFFTTACMLFHFTLRYNYSFDNSKIICCWNVDQNVLHVKNFNEMLLQYFCHKTKQNSTWKNRWSTKNPLTHNPVTTLCKVPQNKYRTQWQVACTQFWNQNPNQIY